VFGEISESHRLSIYVESYKAKAYPIRNLTISLVPQITLLKNTKSEILFTLFKNGYFLRKADRWFNIILDKSISKIDHEEAINEILISDLSNGEKIENIAIYLEQNNEYIELGDSVAKYTIIGLFELAIYLRSLVDYYIELYKNVADKVINKEFKEELFGRTIALGYCFRLAEEIVLKI